MRHDMTDWQTLPTNPIYLSGPRDEPDSDEQEWPKYYQLDAGDIYAEYDGEDMVRVSIGGDWFDMTDERRGRLAKRLSGPFCYWRELGGREAESAAHEIATAAKRRRMLRAAKEG